MLSEEHKSLIRAEEAFREMVRAELAAEKGERSRWQKVRHFLNMPIGGRVLGTVLVAASAVADVRYFNERDAATAKRILDGMRQLGMTAS